jgi:hypothetical protein
MIKKSRTVFCVFGNQTTQPAITRCVTQAGRERTGALSLRRSLASVKPAASAIEADAKRFLAAQAFAIAKYEIAAGQKAQRIGD